MDMPKHLEPLVVAEAQQVEPPLRRLRELQLRKLRLALLWGIGALVVASFASLVLFRDHPVIPMFSDIGFPEWRTQPRDPIATFAAQNVSSELVASFNQLVNSIRRIAESGGNGQIAATSRLLACISIFVAILFTFRVYVADYYDVHGQRLQLEDHKDSSSSLARYTRRVAVALAAMVTSFVALSIVWMLLNEIFKTFSVSFVSAAAFSGLFVGCATAVFVYWVSTMTTRQLAALGLLTFILGLCGAFAMAGIENGEQWWQAAVSRAGADPNANWLFIATIASVSLVFLVVWFDIDQFLRLIVAHAEAYKQRNPTLAGRFAGVRNWFSARTFYTMRLLYFAAILGICGVGFVRFDRADIGTVIAHTGGAFASILIFNLGGLVFAHWFPDPILGTPFKRFSLVCVIVNLIGGVLALVGVLNLAGVELVALIIVGIWFYFALDTLLTYIDAVTVAPTG
jgi:hypothetical protein